MSTPTPFDVELDAETAARWLIRCPAGHEPTSVYPRYTSGNYVSYCAVCVKPYPSTPPRPQKPPLPPKPPRRKPIHAHTLDDVRADPGPWLAQIDELTSHRWQHLRRLVLDAAGWQCQIRRAGCTTTAAEVDHRPPRSADEPATIDGLRACCQSCNAAEWTYHRDRTGPARPLPDDFTAAQLELLRWLDQHDVPRHHGRRNVERLDGCPFTSSSVVDDVCIWRRYNPPGTPYPPLRPPPIGRRAGNAVPRRPLADVADLVDALDRVGVPLDLGPGPARDSLADAGIYAGQPRVDDAQRWRRVLATP